MRIPEPYASILRKNERLMSGTSIKPFIDGCFSDLFSHFQGLSFQSRAKKSGDMFEYLFYYLMKNRFAVEIDCAIQIEKACMEGAGALDFGVLDTDGKVLCGIEAKGSAEKINGRTLPRPALKRTDTMKKAIAQAYQFKRTFPSKPFYIVTNVKPSRGNAKCMMDLAEGDIIDKVYDVTKASDLKDLVEKLKSLRQHASGSSGKTGP